ncbi:MAG: hypothetical protein AAF357_00325 [Verrucomicrobiota bacterium]
MSDSTGSFLSEELQRWKDGEMECACRDMAIYVRQIVKEEIAVERSIAHRKPSDERLIHHDRRRRA